ncbi:hypothetical protein F53441_2482 [Fusarium austroafricanum]|uniref:Cell wall mannoprotein n=1 Tax=Fusarium austroafricanum TaxID=2364996 RepID=A0A8H4PBW4_9HYPO|nr:hypothetical protein F53441_2482 [Fusarium austroafricanum]
MKLSSTLAAISIGSAVASPLIQGAIKQKHALRKRQVPQEHSHDFVLTIASEMLKLDNPKNIQDPVFGFLGDAAAADGAGDVTNLACLKQETADQAFTNAKAIGDLRGMAGSLLLQALERNTAGVGVASVLCNETAVNPEIAALTQHQDAASEGAGAINKAVTLELAKQLAGIGADPNLALLSGTFAPGDPNDSTGAGNSCDDEEPDLGCIFSKNLLVLDATEDEISSAVADVAQTFTGTGGIAATDLVDLASFSVASGTEVANLATIVHGAGAGGAGGAATATATDSAKKTGAAKETDSAKNSQTAGAGAGTECAAQATVTVTVVSTVTAGRAARQTADAALDVGAHEPAGAGERAGAGRNAVVLPLLPLGH